MEHRITAPGSRYAPARLIAVAESVLVTYDYSAARPIPLPGSLLEGIEAVEGRSFRRAAAASVGVAAGGTRPS
jgi:acyl-CoA thioesterase FadM